MPTRCQTVRRKWTFLARRATLGNVFALFDSVWTDFAKYGLPGMIIFLQLIWIWRKDVQFSNLIETHEEKTENLREALSAEQTNRVDDAKGFTRLALKIQSEVTTSVNAIESSLGANAELTDMVERMIDAVETLIEDHRRNEKDE